MKFLTLSLGGPGVSFVSNGTAVLPFTFPSPVRSVHPMLQSLRFSRTSGDAEPERFQVSLVPRFNAGESATDGAIEVVPQFEFGQGILTSSPEFEMEIQILVAGFE